MFKTQVFPTDHSCPCFNCTKETGRSPFCKFDGSCPNKYADWKEKHDSDVKEINKQKDLERGLNERGVALSEKLLRHQHSKRLRGW